jgi:hypothetical protein
VSPLNARVEEGAAPPRVRGVRGRMHWCSQFWVTQGPEAPSTGRRSMMIDFGSGSEERVRA